MFAGSAVGFSTGDEDDSSIGSVGKSEVAETGLELGELAYATLGMSVGKSLGSFDGKQLGTCDDMDEGNFEYH